MNNSGLFIEYKLAINNFYDFELFNGGVGMKEYMIEENDWRLLRGHDEYLRNKKFQYKEFKKLREEWDHEHCEFCWHKFMENPDGVEDCSTHGYCSIDGKYWVCENCFKDFAEKFNMKVVN